MAHRAFLHRRQNGSEVGGPACTRTVARLGRPAGAGVLPGVFPETGGTLTRAKRLDKPGNVRRETHVQPRGDGIVTIVLPACTDCDAKVAIRTGDGRKLSNSNELTVGGPGG